MFCKVVTRLPVYPFTRLPVYPFTRLPVYPFTLGVPVMRMSTVSRLSSIMLSRIATAMSALRCGWIIRLQGVEIGIVKLSHIAGKWVAWTSDCKMVVVNSQYCCRKFDSSAFAACGGVDCCGCSVCV